MEKEKNIILIVGTLIGLLVTLARLSIMGWLFLLGIITAIIFGILHIVFINQIGNRFKKLNPLGKKIAWFGVILYPLIFLFQFDFGDNAGNFYTYEYLTGDRDWKFEYYAYYIAIVSGILYVINFIVWQFKSKIQ